MSDVKITSLEGLWVCQEMTHRQSSPRIGQVESKLDPGIYLIKLRSGARLTIDVTCTQYGQAYRFYENAEDMNAYIQRMKAKFKEQEALQEQLRKAGQDSYAFSINSPLDSIPTAANDED